MVFEDKLMIDDSIIEENLNHLYKSFNSGFEFEDFLQRFLLNVAQFDQVQVTKMTGDGGIDLIAKKNNLIEIINDESINASLNNVTNYKIQAKCWKPTMSIQPKEINQLRGAMYNGDKGLFIATCKYSKNSIETARNEMQQIERPVFLVDGKMLIKTCMSNGFGFKYIPSINKEEIQELIGNNLANRANSYNNISVDDEIDLNVITKKITNNDIRARILRLPLEIKEKIDINSKKLTVLINNETKCELTIDSTKTYLAGVTDIYRKNGLIRNDGVVNSSVVKMFVEKGVLNLLFDEN